MSSLGATNFLSSLQLLGGTKDYRFLSSQLPGRGQ